MAGAALDIGESEINRAGGSFYPPRTESLPGEEKRLRAVNPDSAAHMLIQVYIRYTRRSKERFQFSLKNWSGAGLIT